MKRWITAGRLAALSAVIVSVGAPHASWGADKDKPQKTTLGDLPCIAQEIAKFDGLDWRCSPDETGAGSGPGFLLLDATGLPVGEFVDFRDSSDILEAPDVDFLYSFQDPAGNPRRAILSIGPDSFAPRPRVTVFFESGDCSGTPLASLTFNMAGVPLGDPLPPRTGYDLGSTLSHAVLAGTGQGSSPIDLYLLDLSSAQVYAKNSEIICSPASTPNWNCFCFTGPFGFPSWYGAPVELGVGDFLTAHPLPWVLEGG